MNLRKMIECLQICAEYGDPDKDYCCAEHDILFLTINNDQELLPEHEARLEELGAFRSSEVDCWALFT